MAGATRSDGGPKVKNPKQAIAIALREAGSTNQESPAENRKALATTRRKERRGETARDEAEAASCPARASTRQDGETRAAMYEGAKKKNVSGRSSMFKAEPQRALA